MPNIKSIKFKPGDKTTTYQLGGEIITVKISQEDITKIRESVRRQREKHPNYSIIERSPEERKELARDYPDLFVVS